MKHDQVIDMMQEMIGTDGPSKWANHNGLSRGYVMNVLAGRCEAGPAILRVLGLQKVVSYDWVKCG